MMDTILLWAIIVGISVAYLAFRDWEIRRSTENAASQYRLEDNVRQLRTYLKLAATALPHEAMHAPIYKVPSTQVVASAHFLKAVAKVAMRRYGIGHTGPVYIRFGALPDGSAGRARFDGRAWFIDVNTIHKNDANRAAIIVVHEMAHVLLDRKGIKIEPTSSNEELTDATAALAGFGDLMYLASLKSVPTFRVDGSTYTTGWSSSRIGYLPPTATAFLMHIRADIANYRVELKSGRWARRAAKAWRKLKRSAPYRMKRHNEPWSECLACTQRLKTPKVTAKVRLTCPNCGYTREVFVE